MRFAPSGRSSCSRAWATWPLRRTSASATPAWHRRRTSSCPASSCLCSCPASGPTSVADAMRCCCPTCLLLELGTGHRPPSVAPATPLPPRPRPPESQLLSQSPLRWPPWPRGRRGRWHRPSSTWTGTAVLLLPRACCFESTTVRASPQRCHRRCAPVCRPRSPPGMRYRGSSCVSPYKRVTWQRYLPTVW